MNGVWLLATLLTQSRDWSEMTTTSPLLMLPEIPRNVQAKAASPPWLIWWGCYILNWLYKVLTSPNTQVILFFLLFENISPWRNKWKLQSLVQGIIELGWIKGWKNSIHSGRMNRSKQVFIRTEMVCCLGPQRLSPTGLYLFKQLEIQPISTYMVSKISISVDKFRNKYHQHRQCEWINGHIHLSTFWKSDMPIGFSPKYRTYEHNFLPETISSKLRIQTKLRIAGSQSQQCRPLN